MVDSYQELPGESKDKKPKKDSPFIKFAETFAEKAKILHQQDEDFIGNLVKPLSVLRKNKLDKEGPLLRGLKKYVGPTIKHAKEQREEEEAQQKKLREEWAAAAKDKKQTQKTESELATEQNQSSSQDQNVANNSASELSESEKPVSEDSPQNLQPFATLLREQTRNRLPQTLLKRTYESPGLMAAVMQEYREELFEADIKATGVYGTGQGVRGNTKQWFANTSREHIGPQERIMILSRVLPEALINDPMMKVKVGLGELQKSRLGAFHDYFKSREPGDPPLELEYIALADIQELMDKHRTSILEKYLVDEYTKEYPAEAKGKEVDEILELAKVQYSWPEKEEGLWKKASMRTMMAFYLTDSPEQITKEMFGFCLADPSFVEFAQDFPNDQFTRG